MLTVLAPFLYSTLSVCLSVSTLTSRFHAFGLVGGKEKRMKRHKEGKRRKKRRQKSGKGILRREIRIKR